MSINNTWSSLYFREPLETHEKISAQKYVPIYNHAISNTTGLLLLIRGKKSNSCLGNSLDDLIATHCLDPTTPLMFENAVHEFTLFFSYYCTKIMYFSLIFR